MKSSENQLIVLQKIKSNEWDTVQYIEFNENELKKEWICVRTQFHLKYSIKNVSAYREQLLEQLQCTRSKICENNKPILKIIGTEIVLKKDKGLIGIGKNAKISAAIQQTKTQSNNSNENQFNVLNIELCAGDEEAAVADINSLFSSK